MSCKTAWNKGKGKHTIGHHNGTTRASETRQSIQILANYREENKRLRELNTELLEACKKIRNATHPTSDYFEIVNNAIVKAEGHKTGTVAAANRQSRGQACLPLRKGFMNTQRHATKSNEQTACALCGNTESKKRECYYYEPQDNRTACRRFYHQKCCLSDGSLAPSCV